VCFLSRTGNRCTVCVCILLFFGVVFYISFFVICALYALDRQPLQRPAFERQADVWMFFFLLGSFFWYFFLLFVFCVLFILDRQPLQRPAFERQADGSITLMSDLPTIVKARKQALDGS